MHNDTHSSDRSHVDLAIKREDLNLQDVSRRLGVEATGGFNPNEEYEGKRKVDGVLTRVRRRRPNFGVWHFSTASLVASDDLQEHAVALLGRMSSSHERLNQLRKEGFEVAIYLIRYDGIGFDIESSTMAKLAELSDRITVNCFGWADTL